MQELNRREKDRKKNTFTAEHAELAERKESRKGKFTV
jgi:hypothetical protein